MTTTKSPTNSNPYGYDCECEEVPSCNNNTRFIRELDKWCCVDCAEWLFETR